MSICHQLQIYYYNVTTLQTTYLGGTRAGEELIEDGVEDDSGDAEPEGDHAHRGGRLGALFCCNRRTDHDEKWIKNQTI